MKQQLSTSDIAIGKAPISIVDIDTDEVAFYKLLLVLVK